MFHRATLHILPGALFVLAACSGAAVTVPSLEAAAEMAAGGMLAEAEKETDRVLAQKIPGARDAALTRRGCVRVERGNAQGAIQDLRTVPDLGLEGRACLGKAYALVAAHKQTFVVLAPLVDSGRFTPETAFLAVQAAFALRHMEDAHRLVETAVEKYPEEGRLQILLAKSSALRGDVSRALRTLELAAAVDPDSADAPFVEANILWALERYEEAIIAYGQALKLNPHFVEAARNLGMALSRTGRHEEAVAALRQALDMVPEDVSIMHGLATALVSVDRFQEAVEMLEMRANTEPDPTQAARMAGELDAFKLLLDNLCGQENAVRFAAARLKERGWNKNSVVRVLDSVLSDPIFGTLLEAKESECKK